MVTTQEAPDSLGLSGVDTYACRAGFYAGDLDQMGWYVEYTAGAPLFCVDM